MTRASPVSQVTFLGDLLMSETFEAPSHCIVIGNAAPTQDYELAIEVTVMVPQSQVVRTVMTPEEWAVMNDVMQRLTTGESK